MRGIPITVPNIITMLRIVLIPVFVVAFYLPDFSWKHLLLTVLFFIAGLSDWVDGYVARKLKQHSAFGAFLDPVADKLTVSIAMILLVSAHPEAIMVIPVLVIIGRELAISALREWMANLGDNQSVKVNMAGKWKTFYQFWAIGFILYEKDIGSFSPLLFGYILLYIATILTLWSMVSYLRSAWPSLTGTDKAE